MSSSLTGMRLTLLCPLEIRERLGVLCNAGVVHVAGQLAAGMPPGLPEPRAETVRARATHQRPGEEPEPVALLIRSALHSAQLEEEDCAHGGAALRLLQEELRGVRFPTDAGRTSGASSLPPSHAVGVD